VTKRKKPDPRIRRLVGEAVVDAYDDTEQETGFLTMMEDSLPFPFKALVVGEEVDVTGVDFGPGGRGVEALCERNGKTYRVGVLALEWSGRPPSGAEWLEAYAAWLEGDW